MLNAMRVNDVQLTSSDVRQLENADEVVRFFARLGYAVDARHSITDIAALGLLSPDVRQQILKAELIGTDPVDHDVTIYLFEVRSVTAKLRHEIARRFRDRPENALLVLTHDYSQLEFVLLDRVLARGLGRAQTIRQTMRPIPLTLNRLTPDPVALRVLKRFTFTEEDAAYQWEKLRSAYMLAEWSEEFFNNRALFSDYYLKQRLTDPKLTPAWAEDVGPVGRAAFGLVVSARKEFTRKPEAVVRAKLYEPLFQLLGFAFVAQKSASVAAEVADYVLYAPGQPDTPVAAALTYVWNRNLDDVDEARELPTAEGGTPDEIPGTLVVSLLEAAVAPWVIVTNGKLWRLYSATASNKATNYYEVDLEEALAANDQVTALKYWWLLFRRQAFTGFLDMLVKQSAEYAKELGERLKDRVFVEIFPQFAKGFIADMRAQGVTTFDAPTLAYVFSGTMTFLYRLMFLLYAESLDLLPVHEANGYRELSLDALKHVIAAHGGSLLDAAHDKLCKHYATSSAVLYPQLARLFAVIDQGSDELNMPTYNGGLFSPQTASGQFLATYAIPDRFLALGLDRLARDVDTRTKALVFIDFKSLGVRQLGSIYEGLLEFTLQIASQPLAVTKEKGREVYAPLATVKKPLATLALGDVYLENDKQERKATGSYYTPDYIVKYIVQHTVGPVLDRTFAALTPKLRKAQKDYRDYAKLVAARRKAGGKPETPAVWWNRPEMVQLVDDCLNLRCLDPAMGSGHFLVEVVDYVSNRLLRFLNGWSENPVWAFIEQTRDDILGEMERQHVTIDAERLTRVALLKRAVLKRCVYGVDLNAMAVELAKVSLWLDAFTLGAPLSFLDHHLKHGNSLIGARVKEVQAYLKASAQADMFAGGKFAGVMLATDLMRQVSYLSDNTIAQTRQSAAAYRDASDHLAPYKRLLDVYTSRWFGNPLPKKGKTDPVRLFLEEPETQAWLINPAAPLDNSLIPADTIAATALEAAADKHFFHWELEFPEVFFAPSTPGGQDIQLVEGGGFDAVVGNPPYDVLAERERDENLDAELSFFSQDLRYKATEGGKLDLFRLFTAHAGSTIASDGIFGFIIPMSLLADSQAASLRKILFQDYQVVEVEAFPQKDDPTRRVFKEAKLPTCIIVVKKSKDGTKTKVTIHPAASLEEIYGKFFASSEDLAMIDPKGLTLPILRSELELELLKKFSSSKRLQPMKKWLQSYQGEINETNMAEVLSENPEIGTLVLRGSNIQRYEFSPKAKQGVSKYINIENYESKYTSGRAAHTRLHRIGYQRNAALDNWRRLIFALLPCPSYCFDSVSYYLISEDVNLSLVQLALLNSHILNWRFSISSSNNHVSTNEIDELPAPIIPFTTPAPIRAQLTERAIASYAGSDNAGVLAQVQAVIAAAQTDVVHDLLAHLAQCMIALNQQKQAEVKRFLGWLEAQLKIAPGKEGATGIESLTGKSILQNYLGDYQKNAAAQPWREFLARLHQNRNRFTIALSAVEGAIEREYERTLAVLQPIKRTLARTDTLIDSIVYRLYGLTEAEVELIERPQYEQQIPDEEAK